jgi:hypothetical protein
VTGKLEFDWRWKKDWRETKKSECGKLLTPGDSAAVDQFSAGVRFGRVLE